MIKKNNKFDFDDLKQKIYDLDDWVLAAFKVNRVNQYYAAIITAYDATTRRCTTWSFLMETYAMEYYRLIFSALGGLRREWKCSLHRKIVETAIKLRLLVRILEMGI